MREVTIKTADMQASLDTVDVSDEVRMRMARFLERAAQRAPEDWPSGAVGYHISADPVSPYGVSVRFLYTKDICNG
ncbi:hypothetical protein [Mesorhizobium sp.]|uniref:hypothetical protein n=1 Tax=Mesorhizobium sp. TaxID=1871066 RepID=UPI000FE4754D|nr:hypothetical protein [Mesorhizobium sp.]RWN33454.1 MAG: hypothetical protein EOR95_16035 [Mesorhizobium sp.]RWQ68674.1 MAG: hypothetical protein EOS86_02820 [Mesorhizobium sp.]